MEPKELKTVKCSLSSRSKIVDAFLQRPSFEQKAEEVARNVLADIRKQGDRAVARYCKMFDGVRLSPVQFVVRRADIQRTVKTIDRGFKDSVAEARRRITRFAQAGKRKKWTIPSPQGGLLGERYVPIDRVGAYIPGGEAPLASTALMTICLAKVAGVKEVVACTPARNDGSIDPYLLYAIHKAGATEIYRVGGIQAIGAMAYGTATIGKVDKIVGPGGPYVTAAKRLVYGEVGLDLVAGPSEIAVLADGSANAGYIAADLLSQAEHGTGSEKVLFVTTSQRLIERVKMELLRQAKTLTRKRAVYTVLKKGTLLVWVKDLKTGMELCNRFAPEHFELLLKQPKRWLKEVRSAGAVFLGTWSPEAVGDFVAGPSHVLPTGGAARRFSGLTADDFMKRMSVIHFTQADLRETLPVIRAFSRVEQLDAHGRSVEIRFE